MGLALLVPSLLACATTLDPGTPDRADTASPRTDDSGASTDTDVRDADTGLEGYILINEFLAFGVDDGYAGGADWIEIYNKGGVTTDLTGVTLWADDGTDQLGWAFPAGTEIAAKAFLVVVCDNTNQAGDTLHASFRIGRGDGTLILGRMDAEPLDRIEYGYQATGLSSARVPDGGEAWVAGVTPSPGASNGE